MERTYHVKRVSTSIKDGFLLCCFQDGVLVTEKRILDVIEACDEGKAWKKSAPKKRGRPPLGDKAMSAAEKQKAYRQRRIEEGKPSSLDAEFRRKFEFWLSACEDDSHWAADALPFLARNLSADFPELAERLQKLFKK